MSFGTILKKVRLDRGYTQEELAKKVDTSRSNIANYEVDRDIFQEHNFFNGMF